MGHILLSNINSEKCFKISDFICNRDKPLFLARKVFFRIFFLKPMQLLGGIGSRHVEFYNVIGTRLCLPLDGTKQNKTTDHFSQSHRIFLFKRFTNVRSWFCHCQWWLAFILYVVCSISLWCGASLCKLTLPWLLRVYSFNHLSHIYRSLTMYHILNSILEF